MTDHPVPAASRASELIRCLELKPHPEGGFYREIWRSAARVTPDDRPGRSAVTTIYFLLAAGDFSAWHRVRSDEVWHWYEGEPLELLMGSPDFRQLRRQLLGPVAAARQHGCHRACRLVAGSSPDRQPCAVRMHGGAGLRVRRFHVSARRG